MELRPRNPMESHGSFFSNYPQFSEDSLGLVGRSQPPEFGRWVQWTSVLMARALGGGF